MGEITATIFYIDEDLLRLFDRALEELGVNCSRSTAINFLILKFLIDNGYRAEPFIGEFEDIITNLYRVLQRRKAARKKRRAFILR